MQGAAVNTEPALTRADLISELAASNSPLRIADAELIVVTIFDQIAAALARGERVELRGFGAFTVKRRNARIGHNPRTGETVFGEGEDGAVLQGRQRASRPAQSRWDEAPHLTAAGVALSPHRRVASRADECSLCRQIPNFVTWL